MTWRLVAAQLRRVRWHLGLLCLLGANGSYAEGFMVRFMMAMPMLSAFTALTGLGLFWTRDVRILPIPRRVALRSAWLAALGFPVAIVVGRLLVVAVEIALGATISRGIETITLAAVWETAFVGVSLTIMQGDDVPWDGLRGAVRQGGYVKTLLPMLWIVVPFAAYDLIPRSVAEVNWLHLAGLLAGAVITAWPLVTKPDQWPRLGILHDASRTSTAPPRPIICKPRALDRLTGMRRLLPGPIGTALLVAALTLVASITLTSSLEGTHGLFSAEMDDMEFFLIGGPFFLLIFGPLGWANGLTPFLRSLRTLPVSAMRIVVTMTIVPLMIPVFYWTLATGVHLVVGVPGDTHWRLESFVLLCGVMAFSGAVHARFNSMVVVMMGWGAAFIGAMLVMELLDKESAVAFWFPLVGLVGVSAAFLLNYRTILRSVSSSAVYRPPPGAALYRGGH
jgi:hypothetical protein